MARQVPARNGGTLTRPDKGETMNPNGRPKKGISKINEQLQKKGYSPASRTEIESLYMSLVSLPEEELKKLVADQKQPMLVRIVIRNMMDGKRGFDVIEKILDRGVGKAMQTVANPDGTHLLGDLSIKIIKNENKS